MVNQQRRNELILKKIQSVEVVQHFSESLEKKELCDLLILKDTLEDMGIVLNNELVRRGY